MHQFQQRLFICGFDERIRFESRRISHLITIANPKAGPVRSSWFSGAHLELQFGDVTSEADARRCKTIAPAAGDVERAMVFFREAWTGTDAKILVSCDYGASRSPALAYLFIADQFPPGRESEAFACMLEIRPEAVPNSMVVRLGDMFLKRNGALLKPLKALYARIDAELFPKTE